MNSASSLECWQNACFFILHDFSLKGKSASAQQGW